MPAKQSVNKIGINVCYWCGTPYSNRDGFYSTKHQMYKYNNYKTTVCRECIDKLFEEYIYKFNDRMYAFSLLCSKYGWNYSPFLFKEVDDNKTTTIGKYLQRANTMLRGLTFEDNLRDGINIAGESRSETRIVSQDSVVEKDYEKNKLSVIRSIGYDPFVHEHEEDKALLYWTLENLLDESTVEDPFKLPCVIQIVKNFGQLEHLNRRISKDMIERGEPNTIKQIISAKDSLYAKTLAMAKENGISEINSTTKSKGAGTLSGRIKELQEIGLGEIFVNTFDVETSVGMQQVAHMSASAIYDKLRLDENDYTKIISEQRKLIEQKDKALLEAEEGYRLARVELEKLKAGGSG